MSSNIQRGRGTTDILEFHLKKVKKEIQIKVLQIQTPPGSFSRIIPDVCEDIVITQQLHTTLQLTRCRTSALSAQAFKEPASKANTMSHFPHNSLVSCLRRFWPNGNDLF